MKKPEVFFVLGFVLIILGSIILLFLSDVSGFVVIFPFFYFGDVEGPWSFYIMIVFTIFFLIMILNIYRIRNYSEGDIYKMCTECNRIIQRDSMYCPYCGSLLKTQRESKEW